MKSKFLDDCLPECAIATLILAVADLAYSSGEVFDVLSSCLERLGVKANVQTVPLADVVETVRRLQPDLVIIGHRPLLDDQAMRERWEAAGSPMGGGIIKALKSDLDTRDIPVLLVEAYHNMEQLAHDCGADAYLVIPAGPIEFRDALKALIGEDIVGDGWQEPVE